MVSLDDRARDTSAHVHSKHSTKVTKTLVCGVSFAGPARTCSRKEWLQLKETEWMEEFLFTNLLKYLRHTALPRESKL